MKEIVKQFLNQIEQDQKLSYNTKVAYKSDLYDFLEYVLETDSQIQDINQTWVKNYLKHLEVINTERNSYNRRASTFRTFLRFLYKNKLAPTNFSLIVNNKTTFFKTADSELEIKNIEKIIEETKLKSYERLILFFIGRLGLSATEVASLNSFQVDFENKSINLSDTEKIELPHELFTVLRQYLLEERVNLLGSSECLSLFLNENGKAVTETDIYKLIKNLNNDLLQNGKEKLTTRKLKKLSESKTDFLAMQREILSVIAPE